MPPAEAGDQVVACHHVIRVEAATVLLQWSAGGLFFLWFTTRRREVGLGYGWLLRDPTYRPALNAANALVHG